MNKYQLNNYFDLLIDEEIDSRTNCPVCIDGISKILTEIYDDLKKHYRGKSFQRFLKEKSLYGIYHWKKDYWPIPICKLKKLLLLWKNEDYMFHQKNYLVHIIILIKKRCNRC